MLRVTRVHSDIRGLPLLIDRIYARANRLQSAKDWLLSSHGLMAAIALAILLLGLTGCSSYEFGTNGPFQEANPSTKRNSRSIRSRATSRFATARTTSTVSSSVRPHSPATATG